MRQDEPDIGFIIVQLILAVAIAGFFAWGLNAWIQYEREQETKIQQLREQVSQLQKLVLSNQ